MARTVKEHEYSARRSEILDAAQRLVSTIGYEQMSIQHVLDALHISKGAFYHYFGSKHALMEALVEQQLEGAMQRLLPIVRDPELSALAKYNRFFAAANTWKLEQKAFMVKLLSVWYADSNAIMRHKVRIAGLRQLAPLLAEIARQGVAEGTLNAAYPDQVGLIVISLAHDFGDLLTEHLLARVPAAVKAQRLEQTLAVYADSIERVLGAAPGSLTIADATVLRAWAEATSDEAGDMVANNATGGTNGAHSG